MSSTIVKGSLMLEDGQSCRETRLLAEHKLAVIKARMADLSRMRRLLAYGSYVITASPGAMQRAPRTFRQAAVPSIPES